MHGGAFQGPSSLLAASLRAFPPTGRSTVRDKRNPGPFSVLGSRHPGKESRWLRRSNSQHLMAGWEGPISLTALYIPVPYYILHQKETTETNLNAYRKTQIRYSHIRSP